MSCVDYLKRLLDIRVGDEQWNLSGEEDAFLRTYGRSIGFLAFCRHACLIEKKYDRAGVAVSRRRSAQELTSLPLVAETEDVTSPLLSIIGHIGNVGDVKGSSFINVGEQGKGYLQGFALSVPPPIEKEIEYKVRGPNGAWSDWVAGNAFAGTRGKRQNLSGFSVRLGGKLQQNWELKLIGAFEGVPGVITAGDGQDCVPPNGVGPLRGMQLMFRPQPPREQTFSGVSRQGRTK